MIIHFVVHCFRITGRSVVGLYFLFSPLLLIAQADDSQFWSKAVFATNIGAKSKVGLDYETRFKEQGSVLDAHYLTGSYGYRIKKWIETGADFRYKKGLGETSMRASFQLALQKRVQSIRYKATAKTLYEWYLTPEDTSAEWTFRPGAELKWYTGPVRWTTEVEPLWLMENAALSIKRVRWKTGFEVRISRIIALETFYIAQWRYKKNDTPYTHIGGIGLGIGQ
ncbi:MAG TPA: DUF2490 domain-containing protein [Rhodothermales bacterium]|nr:DUF2490 domain-containing protein [Rhodothermales bacterium]